MLEGRAKLYVVLLVGSVLALTLAFTLGLSTDTKTYNSYDCPYMDPPTCQTVTISPNPLGSFYYMVFLIVAIVSFTLLAFRLFARSTTGKFLIVTILLLLLNVGILVFEHDDYAFASATFLTGPPLILMLVISTIAYAIHVSKVRSGGSEPDKRAKVLLLSVWGGLVFVWFGLQPLLGVIDPSL